MVMVVLLLSDDCAVSGEHVRLVVHRVSPPEEPAVSLGERQLGHVHAPQDAARRRRWSHEVSQI